MLGLPQDLFLLIVSLSVLLLSTVALAFALWTVGYRIVHDRRDRRWAALEAEWTPLVLDILAGERSPEELGGVVETRDRQRMVDFLLRFARRLRGEDRERLSAAASPLLDPLVGRLRIGSPERRALAVETLSKLGRGRYSEEIQQALDDPAPLVLMIAVRALTRDEGPGYVEQVLDRLYRLDTWSPRLLASMLASIGPEASHALRRALVNPARPVLVRKVSAEALKLLNDLESAESAVEVLSEEPNRELQAAALRLLAKVGRPDQVVYVRMFCFSHDYVVRAHALSALASLGSAQDAALLRRCFDDESPWVAIHAATGLREFGQLGVLRELAASDHPRAELALQVLSEAA